VKRKWWFAGLVVITGIFASCDSPVVPVACTDEARFSLQVIVRKPDGSGAALPAAGVQVELIPAQPSVCYQADAATTDASGVATLDGLSFRMQWKVVVTPTAGFVLPDSLAAGIPVTTSTSQLGVNLQFPPEPVTMALYVGDQLVDCVGLQPRKCMMVKTTPDGQYEFFYDTIEGFTFDPLFTYTLRVTRRNVGFPLADGSRYTWHLEQMLSKVPTTWSLSLTGHQFLSQVNEQIQLAIVTNQDLLPRNPGLAAQIQAKIALLQRPLLANEIMALSYYAERISSSMDGRTIPIVTVFTADSMRAGAFGSVNYLYRVMPRLEQWFETPFPSASVRMWYGFTMGNSGGGGLINMEDRGTYEGRTPATRLPFDAILAHEMAHSYTGNEALTQFLELYVYNELLTGSGDVADWTHRRDYVPDAPGNENVHALLDIYRLVGRERMMFAFRAIYPLRPPYGSPLSAAAKQAFVNAVFPEHRAQVAAKLERITF
jgi:hypothetical protein